MKKLFTLILTAVGLVAQNPNTPVFPGGTATDSNLLVASNFAKTLLSAPIGPTDTTINVSATGLFTLPTLLTIDSEIISVCSKTSTTFIVCASGRGFDGTIAASHATSAIVGGNINAGYHNQSAAEIKAIETYLQTNFLGSYAPNLVLASPSVASGAPSFRLLTIKDLFGGTGATSSTFLRGDGTWAAPPSIGGFTQGSVLFSDPSGNPTQRNAQFFWNDTLFRLALVTGGGDAPANLGPGHIWIGAGSPDWGINQSTMNWGQLAVSITNSPTPSFTAPASVDIQTGETVYIRSCTGGWSGLNGGPYNITVTGLNTFTMTNSPDTSGFGPYASNGCVWEYRDYIRATQLLIADGSIASPISTNKPTLNITRTDTTNWGNGEAAFRLGYRRATGGMITPGMTALYLENRSSVAGGLTGLTIESVTEAPSPVFTITSCTAANPTVCTTSGPHNMADNITLTFAGATGSWTSLNTNYIETKVDATHFSIPLNSTGFGALTGSTTATVVQSNFAANFVAFMSGTGPNQGIALEGTIFNGTGTDAGGTDTSPHLMAPFNAACQGSNKCSMGYLLQGNQLGGAGFINGVYFNPVSMSSGGYGLHLGDATGMSDAGLFPNAKWLRWRNAAANTDLRVLEVDPSNNTSLNAEPGGTVRLLINNIPYFAVGVNFRQGVPIFFASVPACSGGLETAETDITDSTTATWGATVTGGGANHVKIRCNGTNWTVVGK